MKKFTAIIVAVAILGLAGCNSDENTNESTTSNTEETSVSTSAESSSDATDNTDSSAETEALEIDNEVAAQFRLPGGDVPDLTNALVNIEGEDGEMTISDLTADKWFTVSCDGYVYLAEPLGIFYDNIENSDSFDENELTFKDAPESVVHEYKKYKVGDMFGDLKLVNASTNFAQEMASEYPAYFNGGDAFFEGELVLTGKCRIAPEDDGYTLARDIQFIPDAESCKLPVMNYSADESGNEELTSEMFGDYLYSGEYHVIELGNADDYPNLDFGAFPEDGSVIDVKVTINNVHIRNILNFTRRNSAELVSLEVVEG